MNEQETKREMTFEEEYEVLQKETKELFETEDGYSEPPFANCVIRRALRCISKLKDRIEQPTANNGWIPCSEQLPPLPKENSYFENKPLELYLVSDTYSPYPYRAFWNGKIFTDGFSKCEVIAWQPLPEPYKESENE